MGISEEGNWGLTQFRFSLSNMKRPLYLMNQSGNIAILEGVARRIVRTFSFLKLHSEKPC